MKNDELYYEKIVSAKIVSLDNSPTFEIPPTTPEEIAVTSVGTIRETIL